MAASVKGPVSWGMTRDSEGHRDYSITLRVHTENTNDGPQAILNASGMPLIGSSWTWGNDFDPWARRHPDITIRAYEQQKGEPFWTWDADLKYSTRPLRRCQTNSIDNPLAEPPKISGSFVKWTRDALKDRHGKAILTSTFEPVTGIEKDDHRAQVTIEQNVINLQLPYVTEMINTLNDRTLWGLEARRIKLSEFSWSRKLWGTCTYYYTRKFGFDIRFDGFDLDDVVDKGLKRIKGQWKGNPLSWVIDAGADKTNADHFIHATDRHLSKISTPMILDGNGDWATDPINNPHILDPIELYGESNFFTLGIPSQL